MSLPSSPQLPSQSSSQLSPTQISSEDASKPDPWSDEVQQDDFKPLTREEALQWRARQSDQSVWQVVRWQIALMVLVCLVSALLTRQSTVVLSVAYGALCSLLPTVLMAYGLSTKALVRWFGSFPPAGARAMLARVFFWEGIKVVLAITMLGLAPLLIADVSWPGLLAGLVVVLKAYWLAFLPGRRMAA